MKDWTNWSFDPVTALITAIGAPAALLIAKLVARHLREWVGFLLEAILINLGRIFKRSVASRVSLRRYCRLYLAGQSQYLSVPTSHGTSLHIDKIFIPLTLEEFGGQGRTFSYSELLDLGKRVRVIGEPGSGKSSLVKRLSRDFCVRAQKLDDTHFPVVLELKKLLIPDNVTESELGVWLYGRIRAMVCQADVYKIDECFDLYAQSRGLVLLLDGLDEVASPTYPRTERAINDLCEHLSRLGENNVVILTMRVQFHQQVSVAYRESFPGLLHLKPFSPTEIYDFLTRWPFPTQEEGRKVAEIYEELTIRPSLRDMCRNPLILSMYVAENQASSHLVAPDSRTEFYSKVTAELLTQRRLRQAGPRLGHSKLREQRERILGALALDHMLDDSQAANSLRWSDGLKVVQEVTGCKPEDAESILLDLAIETGIIEEERRNETFRFIHLTFCEFFAAYEAARGREDGWGQLIERHRALLRSEPAHLRTRLLEVVPFASALLLPRSRQANAISSVAWVGDGRLLARCFFETKMYEHSVWSVFAEHEQARLLDTPEGLWDDEWLRDLHLFNVVVRDAALTSESSRRMPTMDVDQLFAELMRKQENSLASLLAAYANEDAAAAFFFAELSGIELSVQFPGLVISHCDQAPFFALVFGKATGTNLAVNHWRNLLVEAGLRTSIVARYAAGMQLPIFWKEKLAGVPRKEKWFVEGAVKETTLAQLLTLSLRDDRGRIENESICSVLQSVKMLPKPGRMPSQQFLGILGFAVIWGIPYIASVLSPERFVGRLDTVAEGLFASCYFVVAMTLLSVSSVIILRSDAYSKILRQRRGKPTLWLWIFNPLHIYASALIGLGQLYPSGKSNWPIMLCGRGFGRLMKVIMANPNRRQD